MICRYCDRCGVVLKEHDDTRRIITVTNNSGDTFHYGDDSSDYEAATLKADLCYKCANTVVTEILLHQDKEKYKKEHNND